MFESRPGSIRPWHGDIGVQPNLIQALKTRSFENEIIIISDSRIDAVFQVYHSLRILGLLHVLWFAPDKERCLRSATLLQELGCAWSSAPMPAGLPAGRRGGLKRLMLLARITRLAFNVLALDGDSLVLRNPYPWLKMGPLADAHLIVLRGMRGGSAATGVMYVQNAGRRGPVAWALAEAALRGLRWAEAGVEVPSNTGLMASGSRSAAVAAVAAGGVAGAGPSGGGGASCDPGLLLTDTLLSGMAKKACHWFCFRPASSGAGGGTNDWDKRHLAELGLGEAGARDLYQREVVRLSAKTQPSMVALVAAASYSFSWGSLGIPSDPDAVLVPLPPSAQAALRVGQATPPRVPEASAGDAEGGAKTGGLGGDGDGASTWDGWVGSAAAAFQALLGADTKAELRRSGARRHLLQHVASASHTNHSHAHHVSSSHLHVGMHTTAAAALEGDEPSRPRHLTQQAGRATWAAGKGVEKFALAPDWLFGTWASRGMYGFWDTRMAGSPPRQVIATLSRVPGTGPGREAARMALGVFNWTLAALLKSSMAATLEAGMTAEGASATAGGGVGGSAVPGAGDAAVGAAGAGIAKGGAAAGVSADLPRMVALSPSAAVFSGTRSRAEWVGVLRGLAQVAALSGRMLVWPDAACTSPWVQPSPVSPAKRLPLKPNQAVLPYGPLNATRCIMAEVLTPRCLYDRTASGSAWQWWLSSQAATAEMVVAAGRWQGGRRRGDGRGAGTGRIQTQRRSSVRGRIRGGGVGAGGRRAQLQDGDEVSWTAQGQAVVGEEGAGMEVGEVTEMGGASQNVLRGMLSLEFEHLAKLLPADFSFAWAANTIRITVPGVGTTGGEDALAPLRVGTDAVMAELHKVNHQPVVYVSQHLDVDLAAAPAAAAAYAVFQAQCRALLAERA